MRFVRKRDQGPGRRKVRLAPLQVEAEASLGLLGRRLGALCRCKRRQHVYGGMCAVALRGPADILQVPPALLCSVLLPFRPLLRHLCCSTREEPELALLADMLLLLLHVVFRRSE